MAGLNFQIKQKPPELFFSYVAIIHKTSSNNRYNDLKCKYINFTIWNNTQFLLLSVLSFNTWLFFSFCVQFFCLPTDDWVKHMGSGFLPQFPKLCRHRPL